MDPQNIGVFVHTWRPAIANPYVALLNNPRRTHKSGIFFGRKIGPKLQWGPPNPRTCAGLTPGFEPERTCFRPTDTQNTGFPGPLAAICYIILRSSADQTGHPRLFSENFIFQKTDDLGMCVAVFWGISQILARNGHFFGP